MTDITVKLIRQYAKNLDKARPGFPEKDDKLLLTEPSKIGKIAITDVETTDLRMLPVEVTELAIQVYIYNKETLEILGLGESYNELNEPSDIKKLTQEIIDLTGITPEDVKGKKIDWDRANELFSDVDFIIAHNAKFDKSHVSPHIKADKKWLCSCHGVDWISKGAPNKKLEILCLHFGEFTYSGHRAIEDVLSTGMLVEMTSVMEEMVASASKVTCRIEGFVDAFGKTLVKDIITKKDNITGQVFKQMNELNPATGKKDWWWEARNIKPEDFEEIKKKLIAIVTEHNPGGVPKLKVIAVEQSV